jgi:hypothetical protein
LARRATTMLTRAIPRWSLIDVVQAQTLSARSRAADDPKLIDLPWLEELHLKIWNRKDRRPQLFRTVEVTQAHYAALQECLKELHSDRDSPDYDGSKPDVLNVKLDFLRSLPPADDRIEDDYDSEASNEVDGPEASNGVDGPEASNEDDPESLFPSIFSFLDLSTLELKEVVPKRFPSPLLLRREYKVISELIKAEPQNDGGSVIVSGQPGMGEFLVSLFHRI